MSSCNLQPFSPIDRSEFESRRAKNKFSSSLDENQRKILLEMMGSQIISLATAFVEFSYFYTGRWQKSTFGLLSFTKDYEERIYCFRIFQLESKTLIAEEKVRSSLRDEKLFDQFHIFQAKNYRIAFRFADRSEENCFLEVFRTKQEQRTARKQERILQRNPLSSPSQPTETDLIEKRINHFPDRFAYQILAMPNFAHLHQKIEASILINAATQDEQQNVEQNEVFL